MRRPAVFLVTGVLAAAVLSPAVLSAAVPSGAVLAAAEPSGGAPAPRGSVPACTAAVAQAFKHHIPLTSVTAACRGLSRGELNFAVGRAVFEVAGAGQHKTVWRRRAAQAEARLDHLIGELERRAAPPARRAAPPPSRAAAPAGRWGTGLAALAAWLLTVGSGAFMLAGWIRRGGLHPRPGKRLTPAVTLGHFGVASAGLAAWLAYLGAGWPALAWLAVSLLLAAVGLGMATLTVWTSHAVPAPPRTTAGLPLSAPGPRRKPQHNLRVIVPVVHGLSASATILLALLTAVGAR